MQLFLLFTETSTEMPKNDNSDDIIGAVLGVLTCCVFIALALIILCVIYRLRIKRIARQIVTFSDLGGSDRVEFN